MANYSESFGLQYTARSISLPSRLQHPSAIRIEAELNKLKNLKASSLSITKSLSVEAIQASLFGLAELYNCTQELMESSSTQQSILQQQNGILVEDALERSVDLLDLCGIIRDFLFMMKEQVQELQSALRRKNGDSRIQRDISTYLCFREKVKKDVAKSLRTLKHIENRIGSSSVLLDIDYNLAMISRVFREVTSITISVLRSLLVFLSSPASRIKSGGWSLIAKLMITKSSAPHEGHIINNVECVDIALNSLHAHIRNDDSKADVQVARRQLKLLDSSIEGLEARLECLFRQLVKNRVTLLNMLTL